LYLNSLAGEWAEFQARAWGVFRRGWERRGLPAHPRRGARQRRAGRSQPRGCAA